ncbi:hypothetical protein KP509_16G050000 [Ceratopteris richardii]|uniref:BHLH domain-containing protein n=1 Tax=Ceratopteris richardii TaxID=49495 RepID=A0A8T2T359_CERRI|nr:hypothetical protein KP509_16G050000 [Ceratopteris richardii]
MESFTDSDSIGVEGAAIRTSVDYYCQQPALDESQIHMTHDFGSGPLSESTITTLYSCPVSDAASSLLGNLHFQPTLSLHDQQKNSFFAQPMAQAYEFTDNHPMTQSDTMLSVRYTPVIPMGSQNTIQSGLVESLPSSEFGRSNITHDQYSAHSHLLATPSIQYDSLDNVCSHDSFPCLDRIGHRMGFNKPAESTQCSSFRKWGKHLLPTATTFRTGGPINRCSLKYVLRIHLPKLAEKMQQQALRTARTGAVVADCAGARTTQHCQAGPVGVHSISSGNMNDKHYQPRKNEVDDLIATNHMYAERRRRKRQRECFEELRTLVPNIKKRDKVTILEHAIKFIKELQNKVDDLERLISLKEALLAGNLGNSEDAYDLH